MKKFSKIITESKEALPWPNLIKRYPIIGEEDWNKIFNFIEIFLVNESKEDYTFNWGKLKDVLILLEKVK